MKLFQVLTLLSIVIIPVSCGRNVKEQHNKQFTLGLNTDDILKFGDKFRSLISEFNAMSGTKSLKYTEEPGKADSVITLTKGLKSTDGKVGWGQWVTETQEKNGVSGTKLQLKRTIDYSMRLEFDKDYFIDRLESKRTSTKHFDLQKLFFHEVGHGLQMPHNPDPNHVMFWEISGYKDFPGFFDEVRYFFAN